MIYEPQFGQIQQPPSFRQRACHTGEASTSGKAPVEGTHVCSPEVPLDLAPPRSPAWEDKVLEDRAPKSEASSARNAFSKGLNEKQNSGYGDIAELASAICWTPISMLSMLEDEWLYSRGMRSLHRAAAPHPGSFSSYTVQRHQPFIVTDAAADARFNKDPSVTGGPGIRFYAGLPVCYPCGRKIGELCVLDTIQRDLKDWQLRSLALLAEQVNTRLALQLKRF